jgi:hypothetical protein
MKDSGIMEYWNDGIVGRIFALFFVILHFAIRTPQSKKGVILCYGSWMALPCTTVGAW